MDLGKSIRLIMAIIDLVDKVSSNIDNKKHSIGVFLDLSKAFDRIAKNNNFVPFQETFSKYKKNQIS